MLGEWVSCPALASAVLLSVVQKGHERWRVWRAATGMRGHLQGSEKIGKIPRVQTWKAARSFQCPNATAPARSKGKGRGNSVQNARPAHIFKLRENKNKQMKNDKKKNEITKSYLGCGGCLATGIFKWFLKSRSSVTQCKPSG